jgi:hypothetical protein
MIEQIAETTTSAICLRHKTTLELSALYRYPLFHFELVACLHSIRNLS